MSRISNRIGWSLAGALGIGLLATFAGVIYAGPLAPPASPAATGPTQIFSIPYEITQPGSYVVSADLSCPACTTFQNGITVSAGDVTLDLQGFRVRGPAAGTGYGIVTGGPGQANIEIRNGEILDWQIGISLEREQNSRVRNVRVHNNSSYGVMLGTTSVLEDSSITANGGDGVYISPVNGLGNTVARNSISFSGCSGIRVQGSVSGAAFSNAILDNVLVGNSTLPSCDGAGKRAIYLSYAHQNRVDGNTIDGNGAVAVELKNSNFNAVTRNTSTNATGTPFLDTGANNTLGPTQTLAGLSNPWANVAH